MEKNKIRITFDHDEIKEWAEKRGGIPELIDDNTAQNDRIGIRIDIKGKSDDVFFSKDKFPRRISWEQFFTIFDKNNLTMIYKKETEDGKLDNFYRLVPLKISTKAKKEDFWP